MKKSKKVIAAAMGAVMLFTVTAFADTDVPEDTSPSEVPQETEATAESVIEEEIIDQEGDASEGYNPGEDTLLPDATSTEDEEDIPEGYTIDEVPQETEDRPEATEPESEDPVIPEETVPVVPEEDLYDYESVPYDDADYTLYVVVDHEVRFAPDQDSEVAVILVKDTPVHVVKTSAFSPWVGIEINGQIYYINATVLSCYRSDHNDNSFVYWSDSEAEERWIG